MVLNSTVTLNLFQRPIRKTSKLPLITAFLTDFGFWAFPFGSGFTLQSFCSFLTKRISASIPNADFNGFKFHRHAELVASHQENL